MPSRKTDDFRESIMSQPNADNPKPDGGESPPLGSWNKMYAVVLACLGLEVILFYLFAKVFS